MFKGLKRVGAAALAAVLAMSALAGCSKKDNAESEAAAAAAEANAKALITVGDASVSAGAFNFMLRYNMATDWVSAIYRSMYGQDVDIWEYDIFGQGQAYGDTVKDQLREEVIHMLLEQAHMADYGVTLTDDEKAAIKEAATSFISSNDEEVLNNMNATQENVETMLTLRTIQSKMEAEMVKEVDTNVSDEEAAQRAVSYVSFTASTEEEAEEETEELSEAAEAAELEELITEEIEEAETLVEEVVEEIAEEASEAAAVETETEVRTKSADETESSTEAAGETEVLAEEEETEQPETEDPAMVIAREEALAAANAFLDSVKDADTAAFEEAAEAVENGSSIYFGDWTFGDDSTYPDAEIIEATKGLADETLVDHVIAIGDTYYVVYVTSAFDEEATEERKEEIIEERKDALIESLLTGWEGGNEEAETSGETEGAAPAEAVKITVDEEAFAAITFDYLLYQEEETEDIEEFLTEAMNEEATEELSESGTEGESVQ